MEESKQHGNQIAVSLTTIDKYKPGKQKFYLQSLVPTKDKTVDTEGMNVNTSNIMNKDVGSLGIDGSGEIGSAIELEVPKEITRWFRVKFIPPGTRFTIGFDNGDITKPRIMGRDYSIEQGGYNGDNEGESEEGSEE